MPTYVSFLRSFYSFISLSWICVIFDDNWDNDWSFSNKDNNRGTRANIIEPQHGISNNVVHVCATGKGSDQPEHTRSLIRAFASRLNILVLFRYCPNTIWSLHLSKCHIVGNHVSRLNYLKISYTIKTTNVTEKSSF